MSSRRRVPRPRRELAGRPLLPDSPPAHVIAFVDQLDAAVRAGDLPNGQAWHLDAFARPGARVAEVRPRLCAAPVDVDCDGHC